MNSVPRDSPTLPARPSSHQSLLDRRTPVADLPQFLSPEEFRTYVGIGRSTMYDLLRRGAIPYEKYGRCIRIPKTALTQR